MTQPNCAACGRRHDRGNGAKYCSDRCKSWAHRRPGITPPAPRSKVRGCETCGTDISHRHGNARFCSSGCWYRSQHPSLPPGPCDVCGQPAKSPTAKFCSGRCEQWRRRHPGQVWPVGRQCGNCGVDIDHLNPHAVWCSPICLSAASGHRRRARLRDLPSETVNKWAVFKRDNWRCHLCYRSISKTLRWPHPRSASLDHIIPISEPGSPGHVMSNVAASHLTCNLSKHTSAVGEQLLLIG